MGADSKKIGVFSGTFDPPHGGHLLLAHQAVRDFDLDLLLILVNNQPCHKPFASCYDDRVEMVRRLFRDVPAASITADFLSPSLPRETPKENVFHRLLTEFPEATFFQIMGWDSYLRLPETAKHQSNRIHFVIYPHEESIGASDKTTRIMPPVRLNQCSSSSLRDQVRRGLRPSEIDDQVWDYIAERRLYSDEKR